MSEVKVVVIGEILRFDRPFRLSQLAALSGFSRQAVDYHLKKFEEKGYLERVGTNYTVANRNDLIDALTQESTSRNKPGLLNPRYTFKEPENTNMAVTHMRAFIALENYFEKSAPKEAARWKEQMDALRQVLMEHTDESIRNYKNFKNYLTTRSKDMAPLGAKRHFKKQDLKKLTEFFNENNFANLTTEEVETILTYAGEYTGPSFRES